MTTTVLVSTYNSPESLRKSLLGLTVQTHSDFETIVADDGSGAETELILRKRAFRSLNIRHLWQPDRGWRKLRVLNWAIAECQSDYIIFMDGDVIPRADFVASHLRARRPRTYLSASRVHIPEDVHPKITDEDILTNRVFDVRELAKLEPKMRKQRGRLRPIWPAAMNLLTYRPYVFTGSNASAWREDLLAVNGYDEQYGYGSEDRDLGVRLTNIGCRSRWLKYSLVMLHLEHPSKLDHAQLRRNRRKMINTYFTGRKWAELGIDTAAARVAAEISDASLRVA